jgi:hypothetical protein
MFPESAPAPEITIIIRFANMQGFTLRDVDRSLSHAIVMGGASSPGDAWSLHWREARSLLTADQVQKGEDAYKEIIDHFPDELKEQHPKLFI